MSQAENNSNQKGKTMKWTITAEHCNGQSVSHPCRKGVYDDPVNTFEMDVEAESEEEAREIATREMGRIVSATEPCDCRRRLQPGSDRWWDSVAFAVERAGD